MTYAVICHDCNLFVTPLDRDAACKVATRHCDNTEDSKVYAVKLKELFPIVGKLKQGET